MPLPSQPPSFHSNRYSAAAACAHCDGVIRHEPWCVTQSAAVRYAFQSLADSNRLSLADELCLHALGVAWIANDPE